MRRRAYVAALPSLVLAGCSGSDGPDGTDGTDGSGKTPPGAGYDHFREVRIDAVDQGTLSETPLEASVTAENLRITADGTTTVRVSITHQGSEPVGVERSRCPPADKHVGVRPDDGDGKQLLLLRAGEYDGDRAAGAQENCWRPSQFDLNVGEPCRRVQRRLDPGETWTRAYRVWDEPNNRRCLPPGPYQFQFAYALVDPDAAESTTSPAAGTDSATTTTPDAAWSFTVGVYDPGVASPTDDG